MTAAAERIKELEDALRILAREVHRCWGLEEMELRRLLGNTNYHCVQARIKEAFDLLEEKQ